MLSVSVSARTPSDRKFGWLAAAALLAIGLLPRWRGGEARVWALLAAAIFVVIGAVAPRLLHRAKTTWLYLGFKIGSVMSPIVIAILFFGIITPTSFLLRRLGRDALRLRMEPHSQTYWLQRGEPAPDLRLQY
jgi:hypothetical protein